MQLFVKTDAYCVSAWIRSGLAHCIRIHMELNAVLRIRIRKDPKLLAGSGSEMFISDRTRIRIRNKSVKRSLIFRPKKGDFRQLWNISTFSRNNLIRIWIFATQFTSNWLTDNRIIGIHCPVTFCTGVNFLCRALLPGGLFLGCMTQKSPVKIIAV
jgi:hypothetical protein